MIRLIYLFVHFLLKFCSSHLNYKISFLRILALFIDLSYLVNLQLKVFFFGSISHWQLITRITFIY